MNGELLDEGIDAPTRPHSLAESVTDSLTQLRDSLITLRDYVEKVQRGEIQGDAQLGERLLDSLNSMPQLTPSQLERAFSQHVNDLSLLIYLGQYAKQQMSIADRHMLSL